MVPARLSTAALLLLGSCATGPEDPPRFKVQPYVWVPGLQGTAEDDEGGGGPIDLDIVSLDNLSFFAMATLEARIDPDWTLLTEALQVNFAKDGDFSRTKFDVTMGEVAAARVVAPQIEAIAGLRSVDVALRVEVDDLPDLGASERWIDPFIAVRARVYERGALSGHLRLDVGGFDVGSELSTQALGELRFAFHPAGQLHLGYRRYEVEFEDESFDFVLAGWQFGVSWVF